MGVIKFLIEYGLIIFVGIMIITQVVVPPFVKRLPFWWVFKGSKSKETTKTTTETAALKEEVEQKVEGFKEVKEKVEHNLDEATELKNKTDRLDMSNAKK